MSWGILLAFPTVLGMLLLIFMGSTDAEYQTFGRVVVNKPLPTTDEKGHELKKAA